LLFLLIFSYFYMLFYLCCTPTAHLTAANKPMKITATSALRVKGYIKDFCPIWGESPMD
jgi:hypothetical protein